MVIIGIILTFYLGYSVVLLLNFKSTPVLRFAMSYLVGIGIQTLLMFYLAFCNIKLDLLNVSALILVFILTLNLIYYFVHKGFVHTHLAEDVVTFYRNGLRAHKYLSILEKCVIYVIVLLFVFVVVQGFYWPVAGWDSIALYDFRAKVFSQTGYMWDAIERGYFFGYPLMTSMMNTWVYLLGFNYPRFMYSLVYVCFSIVFYSLVRLSTKRLNALLFTLILMISPQIFGHSFFDYTNMPYTTFFFVSTAFMYLFTKNKRYSDLIVSALMMGIATWVRSTDPFWTVNLIVLVIWSIFNKKVVPIFVYIAIFLPIQQSWNYFLTSMSQVVSTQSIAVSAVSIIFGKFDFVRLIQVSSFVLSVVGPMLYMYFILIIIALVRNVKSIKKYMYLNLLVFGNTALLFVGSYVFSYIWPGWSLIGESLGRMSFVFIPLFLYYVSIQNE